MDGRRPAAISLDFANECKGFIARAAIMDRDTPAGRCEIEGDSFADPARGAGDEDSLSDFRVWHFG